MVTEPTHIDGGVFDLVLTNVSDVVEVRVGSPVGTLDHSAVFNRCCKAANFSPRQVVYLKNSVDWKLARGDVKGLNWNEIFRSLYRVSSLYGALLRVIGIRVSN